MKEKDSKLIQVLFLNYPTNQIINNERTGKPTYCTKMLSAKFCCRKT